LTVADTGILLQFRGDRESTKFRRKQKCSTDER
jgi:hypothetical protein